jgi:S-adenosylhomocysteine hydrolase
MPGIMALRHKAKEDKPLKGARFVVLIDFWRITDFHMLEVC